MQATSLWRSHKARCIKLHRFVNNAEKHLQQKSQQNNTVPNLKGEQRLSS